MKFHFELDTHFSRSFPFYSIHSLYRVVFEAGGINYIAKRETPTPNLGDHAIAVLSFSKSQFSAFCQLFCAEVSFL